MSDAATLRNAVFRLHDAFRNAAEDTQDGMDFDITIRENQTMEMVYRLTMDNPDGVKLKVLALSMKLASATMCQIVDSLVKKGLLKRSQNPDDRRAVMITLTNLGQALQNKFITSIDDLCWKLLDSLSLQERQVLFDDLSRMLNRLS